MSAYDHIIVVASAPVAEAVNAVLSDWNGGPLFATRWSDDRRGAYTHSMAGWNHARTGVPLDLVGRADAVADRNPGTFAHFAVYSGLSPAEVADRLGLVPVDQEV